MDGSFRIDTIGSTFDTVIAVFAVTNLLGPAQLVACDNNGAPDGIRSLVVFQATTGTQYFVGVAGVNGAVGVIRLNFSLGDRPSILNSPQSLTVAAGTNVTLNVGAAGTGPLSYQWRLNGQSIPNATNSMLTITNVQAVHGGGYGVVVANGLGATSSVPAQLVVAIPQTLQGDNFADRVSLAGLSGTVDGTNQFSTKEPGEPNHAGKPGGKSVWYTWQAPQTGIATLSTAGSAIDTLLAVYTGTNVANLSLEASDDDRGGSRTNAYRGGSRTSEVLLNAESGHVYQIAIDGYFGDSGHFVLSWELEATDETIPVIFSEPASQMVRPGTNVTFTVGTDGFVLCWYFNGQPIDGAFEPTLTISNVQRGDVGFYQAQIIDSFTFTRIIESQPAGLEIGPVAAMLSRDKFKDLFLPVGPGNFTSVVRKIPPAALSASASDFFSPAAGTLIINNLGAGTEQDEPNHCGLITAATRWIPFQPELDGLYTFNTLGSSNLLLLDVYTGDELESLVELTCFDALITNGPTNIQFNASRDVQYKLVVDRIPEFEGIINVNWSVVPRPMVTSLPSNLLVRAGRNVTLAATVRDMAQDLSFEWRRNGTRLDGATNVTLALTSFQLAKAGTYSVVVRNIAGAVTNTIAVLALDVPYLSFDSVLTNTAMRARLAGASTQNVVLQLSTNLTQWLSFYTNTPAAPLPYLDVPVTAQRWQFLRAIPWP